MEIIIIVNNGMKRFMIGEGIVILGKMKREVEEVILMWMKKKNDIDNWEWWYEGENEEGIIVEIWLYKRIRMRLKKGIYMRRI